MLCERLLNPPYVCNGCQYRQGCKLRQNVYVAEAADHVARRRLVESRDGFDLSAEELAQIDEIVTPLIKKGQSPYHIIKSAEAGKFNLFDISLSTLYRLIGGGVLGCDDLDLKEKARRRPRRGKSRRKLHNEGRAATPYKVGHLYEDYIHYMDEHDTFHVEMDCVEGKAGESPALLTLHYPDQQMQLAFYLAKHDSRHVCDVLDNIEVVLGTELFRKMFPVILTDNGSEFTQIKDMETSVYDYPNKRTKIFFCEPNRSDQKGACENNHKLIRNVIKKGRSLKPFNQEDITVMMNHINSMRRERLGGNSAYDAAMAVFPEEFFEILGLERIPDRDVTLAPMLLLTRIRERTTQPKPEFR